MSMAAATATAIVARSLRSAGRDRMRPKRFQAYRLKGVFPRQPFLTVRGNLWDTEALTDYFSWRPQ